MRVSKRWLLAGSFGALALLFEKTALAQAPRRIPRRRRQRLLRRGRLAGWRNQMLARRLANPDRFEQGATGETVVRAEIIAINPSQLALRGARALGFTTLRNNDAVDVGVNVVILQVPPQFSAVRALAALERADPGGVYALNHVYDPSQGQNSGSVRGAIAFAAPASCVGVKIGMIDAGIDASHPAFANARIEQKCFTGARATAASPHGTAVASLLVGEDDDFRGAAVGASLFAADVFADSAEGGSAEAVANALIWMAQQNVTVVNISLAGPANRALEAVCRAMSARGMIIVAAAGNDGPTRPVGYPAAYPGLVAVTAVDAQKRIYLSANRGPQIAFSALGVNVEAAIDDGAYEEVSGTSFAAPVITAHLAAANPTPATASQTLARLTAAALDLGAPGRDATYGYGLIQ